MRVNALITGILLVLGGCDDGQGEPTVAPMGDAGVGAEDARTPQDQGVADAAEPDALPQPPPGTRRLVEVPLLGDTPPGNRVLAPNQGAYAASAWVTISGSGYFVLEEVGTPGGLRFAVAPRRVNLQGRLQCGVHPLRVQAWIAAEKPEELGERTVTALCYAPSRGAGQNGFPMAPDPEAEPIEVNGRTWVLYSVRIEEATAGVGDLQIDNSQGTGAIAIAAPVALAVD